MKIYYDQDADLSVIKERTVAIIGYGNQGHAHAQNLNDRGVRVVVGLRDNSPSYSKVEADGLVAKPIPSAVQSADVVMILTPDEEQPALFKERISPYLKDGQALAFGHAFTIHFGFIVPPNTVDVFLVAPVGPGHLLRSRFQRGEGIPCLIGVHQDPSQKTHALALSYAAAIGGGRAGILESSFREECETDLFGEQAVIVGGVSALIRAGFETLVEAGYPAELAYYECSHQMKLLTDLIQARGIAGMRDAISNTAKYGDLTRGPRLIDDTVKERMKTILREIQSGDFAEEWMAEHEAGRPEMNRLIKDGEDHPIETVGGRLRALVERRSK